jgi:hypothetical protein
MARARREATTTSKCRSRACWRASSEGCGSDWRACGQLKFESAVISDDSWAPRANRHPAIGQNHMI